MKGTREQMGNIEPAAFPIRCRRRRRRVHRVESWQMSRSQFIGHQGSAWLWRSVSGDRRPWAPADAASIVSRIVVFLSVVYYVYCHHGCRHIWQQI